MRESQLLWQCRRGMRELDVLLSDYARHRYASADAEEKSAFESLLALSDPELVRYLLQKQTPPSTAIANVIQKILEPDPD